ncbi:MAG: hypothetical protein AB7S26_28440 [Sandaracinaceae bacterium]
MRRTIILGLSGATLLAVGCTGNEPDGHLAETGPPAVAGGTLEVAELDGAFVAVASDPARASVFITEIGADGSQISERFRVVLEQGDDPGRVAIDDDGRAHVVARQSGDVISIDLRTGEILERRHTCAAPRGIDIDRHRGGDLWVACAEGIVVRLAEAGGGVLETVRLRDSEGHPIADLRDVVVQEDVLFYVSRFRSAEILVVRDAEGVIGADDIHDAPRVTLADGAMREMDSTVAWRMRRIGTGNEVLLVFQQAQSSQLGTLGAPAPLNQYYGGSCDYGVIRSAIARFNGNTYTDTQPVANAVLVVDGAVAGSSIALAAASEPSVPRDESAGLGFGNFNGVRSVPSTSSSPLCTSGFSFTTGAAEHFGRPRAATGVAVLPDGHVIAQYRDPGELVVGRILGSNPTDSYYEGSSSQDVTTGTVRLSGGSVENAGHALMHEAAGSGAACASCHPEGGDDGHVWKFDSGIRRTQTMNGGILNTAPFHWASDVRDMTAVMDGTFVGRMGGTRPAPAEIAAFEQWVDALPATPGIVVDSAQVDRGRSVFMSTGCTDCHSGDLRTNNEVAANNEVPMAETEAAAPLPRAAVPALYEVIYHAPYFHNGTAETLDDVVAMHHGDTLDEAGRTDLVAYLRSL